MDCDFKSFCPIVIQPTDPRDVTIQGDAKKPATTGAIEGGTDQVKGCTTHDVHISCASVNNSVGSTG